MSPGRGEGDYRGEISSRSWRLPNLGTGAANSYVSRADEPLRGELSSICTRRLPISGTKVLSNRRGVEATSVQRSKDSQRRRIVGVD